MAEKPRILIIGAILLLLPLANAHGQAQDDYIVRSTVNNNGDYLYVRIPDTNNNGFDLVLRRANGTESTILRCANTSSSPITFTSTVPPGRQATGYLEGFGRYFNLNDNGLAAVRIGIADTQDGGDDDIDDPNDPNDPYGSQAIVTVTSTGVVKTIVLDGDMIAGEAVGDVYYRTNEKNISPWPGLNNSGQVLFHDGEPLPPSISIPHKPHADYDESAYRIIRYTPPATYERLLRLGDQVGGLYVFIDGTDNAQTSRQFNSSGHYLTRAELTNAWPPTNPVTVAYDSLLLLNGPGNLTEVAREGDTQAPLANPLVEVDEGVLNDNDQVLYKVSDLLGRCSQPSDEALVRFTPPSTKTVIAATGYNPGMGGPTIQGFGRKFAMNNQGHVAFMAGMDGGTGGGPQECNGVPEDEMIFFWNGSSLTPIARTTSIPDSTGRIPESLGSFDFEWFANFVHLNDNDTVVFMAENGYDRCGEELTGWFSWSPTGGLTKLVAEGDQVQGGIVTNIDPKPGQDGQKMLSNTGFFAVSAALNGPAPGGTECDYQNRPDSEDIPITFIPISVTQQAATQVPTLGVWAAGLLALLLAGMGLLQMRRRAAAA